MNAEQLRDLQSPLKHRYRDHPAAALVVMRATGAVVPGQIACAVETGAGNIVAGLHPAAGGDGSQTCSGDMLLQALVACSGVTLAAVATALSIPVKSASIDAQAAVDFRGTLGVDRTSPVGIVSLTLSFQFDSTAEDTQLAKLVELTERYCVVLQSLTAAATIKTHWSRTE